MGERFNHSVIVFSQFISWLSSQTLVLLTELTSSFTLDASCSIFLESQGTTQTNLAKLFLFVSTFRTSSQTLGTFALLSSCISRSTPLTFTSIILTTFHTVTSANCTSLRTLILIGSSWSKPFWTFCANCQASGVDSLTG